MMKHGSYECSKNESWSFRILVKKLPIAPEDFEQEHDCRAIAKRVCILVHKATCLEERKKSGGECFSDYSDDMGPFIEEYWGEKSSPFHRREEKKGFWQDTEIPI